MRRTKAIRIAKNAANAKRYELRAALAVLGSCTDVEAIALIERERAIRTVEDNRLRKLFSEACK